MPQTETRSSHSRRRRMVDGSPSYWAAENLQRWRKELQLTADEVAKRVKGLGHSMSRDVVASIENGTRAEVTIEELFALAMVLNVSPIDLVQPHRYSNGGRIDGGIDENGEVRVTKTVTTTAFWLRAWLEGHHPVLDNVDDEKALRKAPVHVLREREAWRHPVMGAWESVRPWLITAIVGPEPVEGPQPITPQITAQAIREGAQRFATYCELLAQETEAKEKWS